MPIALKIDWASVRNRFIVARSGAMIAELERTMLREMDKTRRYAIRERMASDSGPPGDLLHVRTGTLRNSMFADARSSGGTITGVLGAGVGYAGVHEHGGTVNVPGHTQTRDSAFGRPTRTYTVSVRAHTATYPQRAFIRPSLDARRSEIIASLAGTARMFFK